jgi:flagella basal body P-ring formation protein FlgA
LSGSRQCWLLAVGMLVLGGRLDATTPPEAEITSAIERAVQARVGRTASVTVSALSGIRVSTNGGVIVAQPEPSSRIGDAARFLLSSDVGGRTIRIGEATAAVIVVMNAVRARHDVARGARLELDDLDVQSTDLRGRPFGPLPSLEEAVGARAKRDIGSDAVVTSADIAADPLVRAGDTVRVRVRVGDVEIMGQLVALENGSRDAVIRVINQDTRHTTRARVIGRAEVEVVNVR